MTAVFVQLAVILLVALAVTALAQWVRQPPLVGYLVAGMLVGPLFLNIVHAHDAIEVFAKIGVALLLFIVGLSLKPQLIREVGRVALVTGLGQIIVTAAIGYPLARALGYAPLTALYLAVAFTFSSTIIVLQLLYAQEEQDTLYGRITTGFLLVQDFVALLAFLVLTSVGGEAGMWGAVSLVAIKVVALTAVGYLVAHDLVPRIDVFFARRPESLFLFGLAACFGLAVLFATLDFSIELGALAAGLLLAASPYHREMATRLSPLRDFFLLMFFVFLGAQVSPDSLRESWAIVASFSVFILVANPLVVLLLMRRLGYALETSFLSSLAVAQISEFSLILLATGVAVGHLPETVLGPATVVGLITIFASSYFIRHNRDLYRVTEPFLRRLFGSDVSPAVAIARPVDVILFGCHRLGGGIIRTLQELGLTFLVIDHNPEIIRQLKQQGVLASFGSASDVSYLELLPFKLCRMVISTIPDAAVNATLLEYCRRVPEELLVVCVANHQHQAERLYQAGAAYVVVPPYLGRQYLVELLKTYKMEPAGYAAERSKHEVEINYLKSTDQLSLLA